MQGVESHEFVFMAREVRLIWKFGVVFGQTTTLSALQRLAMC